MTRKVPAATSPPVIGAAERSAVVRQAAISLGFDLVGIAPAVSPGTFSQFTEWLERGFAGEMSYLQRRRDAYQHPDNVLPAVRSVVMLALNYQSKAAANSAPARVARYAGNDLDYHDILRGRLKQLGNTLQALSPGCRTRGVVDTAPLLERDFARLAGLGWFGKNTMLIHRRTGSWLFLAALLTDVELEPDAPHETAHCGTCTRCLEACPTEAFTAPYELDARRCISYLTIELRDQPIPEEFREPMGDWLFGCDICQEVCPWNRKAPVTNDPDFLPGSLAHGLDPVELLALGPAEFQARFGKSPLARPGRAGILRNAAIVLGNALEIPDERAVTALLQSLHDSEPLVRGAAAWALGQRAAPEVLACLRSRLETELDETVRHELEAASARVAECLDGRQPPG